MPDITQDDGWKEICAIVDPNKSCWLTDPDKCSEIQGRLSRFNQNHSRPLAKKIYVILKDLLKFRSNFELLG